MSGAFRPEYCDIGLELWFDMLRWLTFIDSVNSFGE
jgi:hypothetical protein